MVTLREESRLNVFQNRVLRRIFGPKRGEVTGKWRRIHNEELYAMYYCDKKKYGECCYRVRSNGKAVIFNKESGASNLSDSVRQVSTCSVQTVVSYG